MEGITKRLRRLSVKNKVTLKVKRKYNKLLFFDCHKYYSTCSRYLVFLSNSTYPIPKYYPLKRKTVIIGGKMHLALIVSVERCRIDSSCVTVR